MTFLNENMYLILVGVGILVLLYLFYYIYSYITSEVNMLKKKIKKIQSVMQQQHVQFQQSRVDQMQQDAMAKRLDFVQFRDGEDSEVIYEKNEIDADSYFDPTKIIH